jgi:hypothetical protein
MNASSRRKRIYLTIFVFTGAFLLLAIGASIPIDHQTATTLVNQLNETVTQNQQSGTLPQYIFLNNFRICLAFFIPIFGPAFGFVSFLSTGYYIGAESQVLGFPPLLYVVAEFLNPIFWIEFISYSIAIAESLWLFRRLMQKRFKEIKSRELKNLGILIGICAALLVVGAIIESMLPLI